MTAPAREDMHSGDAHSFAHAHADLRLFMGDVWHNIVARRARVSATSSIASFRYWRSSVPGTLNVGFDVVFATRTRARLPEAFLRPCGVVERVKEMLMQRRVAVGDPDFNRRFLLTGNPEAQVRDLFRPAVALILGLESELCVECSQSRLVLYRRTLGESSPADTSATIDGFERETLPVIEMLAPHGGDYRDSPDVLPDSGPKRAR